MTDTSKPLWKRITEFPLVAMLIALALAIGATTFGNLVGHQLLPAHTPTTKIVGPLFVMWILLVTYHYAIARLGEEPRDDFRLGHAARDLGGGLALGFVLFAAVVGIAALLGVYAITGRGDSSQLLAALVGTANGSNPVSVLVPCHRVIRSDGTLGGYGGGLPNKVRLLTAEGIEAAPPELPLVE